jgi:hypothetical protein
MPDWYLERLLFYCAFQWDRNLILTALSDQKLLELGRNSLIYELWGHCEGLLQLVGTGILLQHWINSIVIIFVDHSNLWLDLGIQIIKLYSHMSINKFINFCEVYVLFFTILIWFLLFKVVVEFIRVTLIPHARTAQKTFEFGRYQRSRQVSDSKT